MTPDMQKLFSDAVRLRQSGNLAGAELLYRQVLSIDPRHADSLHSLGLVQYLQGHSDSAIALIGEAVAIDSSVADYHSNLGLVLGERGRRDEAVASFRRALQLEPNLAESWNNLGNVLADQNRLEAAMDSYRKAIALQPQAAAIHVNLAGVLRRAGKLDEAAISYRSAMALAPHDAEIQNNFGDTLLQQGRLQEAESEYRRALVLRPRDSDAINALSKIARARDDTQGALTMIQRSLRIKDSAVARRLFAEVMQGMAPEKIDGELLILLTRAITEAWDWPDKLAKLAADLVRPAIAEAQDSLIKDPLLHALLISCPNCDLELETFLAAARRRLLGAKIDSTDLIFAAALARQCFINEYVFSVDAEEMVRAEALRLSLADALEQNTVVSAELVSVVAAYFPLGEIPHAARLTEQYWPEAIEAILTQQVREPATEARLRDAIPHLTPIYDEASLRVRAQYEEHPYPRWVRIGAGDIAPQQKGYGRDILVAGCGTGQYLVALAQQSPDAHILAVDLSLASLAYAWRKAQEAGLHGIAFAQADLLELGTLERSFDLIECGGVLHMLDDPLRGWRTLLSLLRPGGTMRVALYSELGRRNIVAAKDFVRSSQKNVTTEDIRSARRRLIEARNHKFRDVTDSSDFFSLSGCRNLLFLAQERRMTLEDIAAFLSQEALTFLGFSIDDRIQALYRQRFSDNPDATNLAQWHIFERENPNTFVNMYQLWVRKGE
jgi:Tfp pilus assembly protein PilF/SAM-dependent methyltransferase